MRDGSPLRSATSVRASWRTPSGRPPGCLIAEMAMLAIVSFAFVATLVRRLDQVAIQVAIAGLAHAT